MTERRDDLSTADLATPQSTDTTRSDRAEEVDLERQKNITDDPGREDLRQDDLARDPAVVQDRPADVEPGRDSLQQSSERSTGPADASSVAGPLLASEDAEGFRARWTDIQTGFVDAPRRAVEQADGLVAELMQHLARTFADERGRLERQWDQGDDVPTDDLRTAFQRYRSFFERLLAT
jgi:hypothetical protein